MLICWGAEPPKYLWISTSETAFNFNMIIDSNMYSKECQIKDTLVNGCEKYFSKWLTHRALMICSKSKLDSELEKLTKIFLENGYPEDV